MAANVVPYNADKLLFAHDIVNYVCRAKNRMHINHMTSNYRESIHEGFTPAVIVAVEYLQKKLSVRSEEIFKELRNEEGYVLESVYRTYADRLRRFWFSGGFCAENFLKYCVHLTMLAMRYHEIGVASAPQLAVNAIMTGCKDYDMIRGGWASVETAARNIEAVSLEIPTLTI